MTATASTLTPTERAASALDLIASMRSAVESMRDRYDDRRAGAWDDYASAGFRGSSPEQAQYAAWSMASADVEWLADTFVRSFETLARDVAVLAGRPLVIPYEERSTPDA